MKKYLFCLCLGLFMGCEEKEADPDAKVVAFAAAFADAYFNMDFTKARGMVAPEDVKWLRFMASNVTQEDVDLLNAQEEGATAEAEGYERLDDSTLVVTMCVRNYLVKDSLGAAADMAAEGRFRFVVVERGGDYKVRMEGLPRSERQSRD